MKISANNITIAINDTDACDGEVNITIANAATDAITTHLTVYPDGSVTVQPHNTEEQDSACNDDEDNRSEETEYIISELTDEENEALVETLTQLADNNESASVVVTEAIARRMGRCDCSFTGAVMNMPNVEEVMFCVDGLGLVFSLTDDDGACVNPAYIHSITIHS